MKKGGCEFCGGFGNLVVFRFHDVFSFLFWLPSRCALAIGRQWGLRASFQDFLDGKDNVSRKSLRLQRFARYLFHVICGH
jgi:hypothetical protein